MSGRVWLSFTARPPPPVILPGAAVAALRLAGALRRASPFGLALPRVRWGGLQELGPGLVWLHRPPTPTRNPPWRGGRFAPPCRRFAPGFALRARAAACCLMGGCRCHAFAHLDMNGGARKKARCGSESTSQVPICKTATTPDWRARRGEACVVKPPKSFRPHLQAEPFDGGPRRAFFRAPV